MKQRIEESICGFIAFNAFIVHEPEQARGDRRQKVEIIYNNVGAVDRLALKGLRM